MQRRLKNLQSLKKRQKINTFKLDPFGEKNLHYLNNSDAPINIQHGAIRSAKTTASIVRWIVFVTQHHYDKFIMTGYTHKTLYRNVLEPMMSLMDSYNISYDHKRHESIMIEDKKCYLMGLPNEGVLDSIPGMTLGGWYGDEWNTYLKRLVDRLLDRLSEEGAQAFLTSNPDNPYHYMYKEYIKNEEQLASGDVKVWNYTIWDNPSLSEEYIQRTIRRYPEGTVDYKRKIQGEAAVAEGIIYKKFVPQQNTFTEDPYELYDAYVLSTDYGAGNVTVIGLFGIKKNPNGNEYHLLVEFYYDVNDPKNNGVPLTDKEVVDEGLKLLSYKGATLPLDVWYTPHDAASLRAELLNTTFRGKPVPYDSYTPDVINDINTIQSLFADERFKISKNCENSIIQAQTYMWDTKAKQQGKDAPLKRDDHCPDMWRAAILGTRSLVNNPFTESKEIYESSKWK